MSKIYSAHNHLEYDAKMTDGGKQNQQAIIWHDARHKASLLWVNDNHVIVWLKILSLI